MTETNTQNQKSKIELEILEQIKQAENQVNELKVKLDIAKTQETLQPIFAKLFLNADKESLLEFIQKNQEFLDKKELRLLLKTFGLKQQKPKNSENKPQNTAQNAPQNAPQGQTPHQQNTAQNAQNTPNNQQGNFHNHQR